MTNPELPFAAYPEKSGELLRRPSGNGARHGYVLDLQRLTKQDSCAYCGVSLVDTFEHWLLICGDHVVPKSECNRLGVPKDWRDSCSNLVLCCRGCNEFDNYYSLSWDENPGNWTIQRFKSLREKVFLDRKARILRRRDEEIAFFNAQPWENR